MKYLNFFAILTFSLIIISCSRNYDHDLVISNVNIINLQSGNILQNQSVAIDSNIISNIYKKEVSYIESIKIIDGTNKFLIHGLWDMHIHYYWNYEDINPLLIANGIVRGKGNVG